jgi:hypothetical protein
MGKAYPRVDFARFVDGYSIAVARWSAIGRPARKAVARFGFTFRAGFVKKAPADAGGLFRYHFS